ncbi:hypothetical protein Pint_33350 [Pistacia integerrima]|uniref:Uncharacterized protein n=1 Tax=Pistacia integerrima TaxID=434235 RepID=A0ACC0X795_9ROSI|nr:hypothetical protein Pint_33350 [Pistacia integerrima]
MSVMSATFLLQSCFQQCPSPSLSLLCPSSSFHISVLPPPQPRLANTTITCCVSQSQVSVVNSKIDSRISERNEIRLGLPSKGRMAADTLDLLKDCQLSVRQVNPRQYVAQIPQLSNLEVWFQRPKDIVRKLLSGDLDLGIVGLDTVSEYGQLFLLELC